MVLPLLPADPRILGKWELQARLGSGGMGTVYLGTDGSRQAAVKAIAPSLSGEASFRARFRREIAICAKVNGPQVADLLDADPDSQSPWFAIEYVQGPTLAQAVGDHGVIRGDALRALAIALLEGLRQIHAAGVVHRDLKPSNVILAGATPIIIDFGIARATEGTAITTTGFVGSAGWTSPEQVRGEPNTPASDVFSWALVVAYAATGTHPYGTGAAEELAYRVVHGRPHFEAVPRELSAILAAATSSDPSGRPTVEQLITSLSEESDATQLITSDWATFVATNPWLNETKQLPSLPPSRRSGRRTLSLALATAVLMLIAAGAAYWWTTVSSKATRADVTPPVSSPTDKLSPRSSQPPSSAGTEKPTGAINAWDATGSPSLEPTCDNVEAAPANGLRCRQALLAVDHCGLTAPLAPGEEIPWPSVRSWVDANGLQIYVSQATGGGDADPTLLSCGARTNGIEIPGLLAAVAIEAQFGWGLDDSGQQVSDLQCGPTGLPKRHDDIYVIDQMDVGESQVVCTVLNQDGAWVGYAFASITDSFPYWEVVLGE
ncbi:serine/threonine protein kinase AfsK [Nocardioidaceae bacterium Broad-1]|nr:serine/threonine protein kinase AfsK [Nocardioidaceae bacterium Broad-1]